MGMFDYPAMKAGGKAGSRGAAWDAAPSAATLAAGKAEWEAAGRKEQERRAAEREEFLARLPRRRTGRLPPPASVLDPANKA